MFICSEWLSLEAQGFLLGKVSTLFLKKTAPTLDAHLLKLAQGLSLQLENLRAFYCLLFLLTLEFSEPGVLDMIQYLNRLQTLAVQSDLPVFHRNALHAMVAGILYLISKISSSTGFQEHILQVLALRKISAVHLLPDGLFALEYDGIEHPSVKSNAANETMLFILDEDRRSPEQKKVFGEND